MKLNKEFYDFIDVGCSKGDSINFLMNLYGTDNYLGIDTDDAKLKIARTRNFHCEKIDLLEISNKNCCSFVSMYHLIEHLSGYDEAAKIIIKAASLCQDFLFIATPFFDADFKLFKIGKKIHWSDYTDHKFKPSLLDIFKLGRDASLISNNLEFDIYLRGEFSKKDYINLVDLKEEKNFIPITTDISKYEEFVKFNENLNSIDLYKEIVLIIRKSKIKTEKEEKLIKKLNEKYSLDKIFSSQE